MRWWPAFFFLVWTGAYAQVPDREDLRGRVLEDSTGVSNVHVVNLSAAQGTISDQEGFFSLPVREGDTLLVSAIRYERITFRVSREMLGEGRLMIALTPFVNELDEVVLYPYNLSGDLGRDLGNLPVEEPVTAASLGLPNAYARVKTQTERMLFEATTGGGIVPLNPVLNAISGRTRMLKKRLARDQAYQQTLEVRARYPDSVFVGQLGVPALRIPDFMYYCEADPAFADLAEGDPLRMWEFLREKSAEYRKNNGLE